MFKRFGLFFLMNMLVLVVVSIATNVLGVNRYLTANGINYEALMIYCLIWGFAGSFISLALSKFMAKTAYGVQIVDAHGPYGHIVRKVQEFARREGLKDPEVGVYHSPEINAFATGPTKNNSLVAVSTGLLDNMSQDEVEGVLGHEVAHIANGDMVTMTLLQGVMNAFVLFFAKIITFAIDNATRDEDGRGGLGMFARIGVEIALQILFGILAQFVIAAFSRYREYRADAGGAKLAGRDKMINALSALQRTVDRSEMVEDNKMAAFKISSGSKMLALLSTHPPLESRIQNLQRSM